MKQGSTRTHAIRVAIELRRRILNGEFEGGSRLFEVALAESMQVSRTPVREAMFRLAEEGLLERVRGGGFTVRTFSLSDVADAIELRGVLEGTAARLAAERGVGEARLRQIHETLEEMEGCFGQTAGEVDFDGYCDLNARFHTELASLAGSEVLRREIDRVTHLPFASPSAFLPNNADVEAFRLSLRPAQEQHRDLLDAIVKREGTRAEAIAREHARAPRRNLDILLAGQPDLLARMPALALLVT